MKTIDKILYRMKRSGPVTAKVLSQELGMTTMGVRQHLQGLEEEGLVEFYDVKVKVGRPTRHWTLTPLGHNRFADRHGELTIQLLDSVKDIFGDDGLQRLIKRREEQTFALYHQAMAAGESLKDKLEILTTLRERDGYMAELQQEEDHFLLIENHCPVCHAAARCPPLCHSELSVFRRLLGSAYQVERNEHIVAGERRCAYRIQKLE